MKNRTHRLRNFFILLLLVLMCSGSYYIVMETDVFMIKSVSALGNHRVSEEDLVAFLGLEDGIHYFSANPYQLTELLNTHPQIKKGEVVKVFPNTLEIKVEERIPVIALKFADSYLLIDEDLFVTATTNSPQGFYEISGKQFDDFTLGKQINDANSYMLKNIISLVYLIQYYPFEVEPEIKVVKDEIRLIFSDHFHAVLGDGSNIESKYKKMYDLYETLMESGNAKGLIIVNHDGPVSLAPFRE